MWQKSKKLLKNNNFRNNQNYVINYKKAKKYIVMVMSNWIKINNKYWYNL